MHRHRRLRSPQAAAALVALGAIALAPAAAFADAGGVGFWLPGSMGSLSAVPGQPGWSLTTVYIHLEANAGAGKELQNNASIVTGLHARADAVGFLPAYTFATPVLGGQLTIGAARVPRNVGVNIGATLTGPRGNQISGSANDERTTFADVYYLATLKWNQGVNNYMWYVLGNIPSGTYDATRLANLSPGYTAVDSGVGYTYLNPATGHELSAVAGFTYNGMNDAIQYRNGIDFHFDWAVAIRQQERPCRLRRLCLPAGHRRQRRRRQARRVQGPLGRHRAADRLLLPRLGRIYRLSEPARLLGRRHREPADHPDLHGDAHLCAVSAGAPEAARAEACEVAGRAGSASSPPALLGVSTCRSISPRAGDRAARCSSSPS